MSASDPREPGSEQRFARDGSPHDAPEHAPQHAPESAEDRLHERLCAHVLGELPADERAALDRELERSPALARERARVAATIALAKSAFPPETLSPETLERLRRAAHDARPRRFTLLRGGRMAGLAVAAGLLLMVGALALRGGFLDTAEQGRVARQNAPAMDADAGERSGGEAAGLEARAKLEDGAPAGARRYDEVAGGPPGESAAAQADPYRGPGDTVPPQAEQALRDESAGESALGLAARAGNAAEAVQEDQEEGADGHFLGRGQKALSGGGPSSPGSRAAKRLPLSARSPASGGGDPAERGAPKSLRALGYAAEQKEGDASRGRRALEDADGVKKAVPEETGFTNDSPFESDAFDDLLAERARVPVQTSEEELVELTARTLAACRLAPGESAQELFFRCWGDHPFVRTADDPLSTFSVDVDTASYALARRTLRAGGFPVPEQVRTEEFVNYFAPDVAPPGDATFRIALELAPSRFGGPDDWMLRVSLRAREVDAIERPPVALTFVVDVSGSMDERLRLPLVKEALRMLVGELSTADEIALVSFASDARVDVAATSAANRGVLEDALDALAIRGGTNVEAGLVAGFAQAAGALRPQKVNRVVLLSDGVGNIGETDQMRLLELVAEHRAKGIYLNTIGVGLGDHDDAFLEQLADRGDGVCSYVDGEREAKKVLVDDFTKTLTPVARDVKIQVELDPAAVASYRQLGYENRALADAAFRDDAVDAGEVNAGHQVTALYELRGVTFGGGPLATVRVRYKPPFAVDAGLASEAARASAEVATEIERKLAPEDAVNTFAGASPGFRRAVLVAQFAELLRRSVHARGDARGAHVAELEALRPSFPGEEYAELEELVRLAQPGLEAAERRESDALLVAIDELCRLHYEAAQDELVGAYERELAKEAGDERSAEADAGADAGADAAAEERARRIAEAEARVAALLRERLRAPDDRR